MSPPRWLRLAPLILAACAAACTKGGGDDSSPVGPEGPALLHTPAASVGEGTELLVEVSAEDPDGVAAVTLVYRAQGSSYWSSLELSGSGELWSGSIPADEVAPPALEYYFKAEDASVDAAVSYLPVSTPSEQPFEVPVNTAALPLPFDEDFELGEGELFLYQLGWGSEALGFPGYVWTLSEARAASGTVSAFHAQGVDGVDPMNDWLISPALDFTGQSGVQVSWWEYGASVTDADHSLYLSTGSRDPADGQYELVTPLLVPESGAWGRSQVVDLSAWAGEPVVYLAWVYNGADADDWYLDDISVRALTLDLESVLSWDPDPVHPGQSTTLTLGLDNLAAAEAAELVVSVSAPEGAGSFAADAVTVGPIAAQGSVDVPFELTVDPAWPDHSPLPLTFTATDGQDTWTFEHTLVVGLPSEGRVDLNMTTEGTLRVSLGVGDPDAPTWEEEIFADYVAAGVIELSEDLTARYALLPPAAGPLRWFARVDTSGAGRVTAFELDYGGTGYAATVRPALIEEGETLVWLPEPPDPVVVSDSTTPSPVAPGELGVALNLVLRNDGEDFSGPLTLTLSSTDPHVTLADPGPVVVDAALLEANESTTLSGIFSLDVSADHTTSLPLALELGLDDGVEQWTLPLEVEVPWPVLKVTAVEIDDGDGGDGDGLLEPGETATLEVAVTNTGDLDAFGVVQGSLVVGSGSTATATSSGEVDSLGTMTVGRTRTGDFEITVDAASSVGQTLELSLALGDGTATWSAPFEIVLGELPWLTLSAVDDAVGDQYGYTFDLLNAQYRCDGTTLELLLESASVFDPGTAFVEMWTLPSAADYTYYRLVLQSGAAKLQGYDGGFYTLLYPTVSFPDGTHVLLSWPVADMGLTLNTLRVGFGAGWCGSDTGSFCDHFPDGWGYYYGGGTYTTSRFYTLSW